MDEALIRQDSHIADLPEIMAEIGLGLGDVARSLEDLQYLVGKLVECAGLSSDHETILKAQSIDLLTQSVWCYSRVIGELSAVAPEDCSIDRQHLFANLIRTSSAAHAMASAHPRNELAPLSDECEFF